MLSSTQEARDVIKEELETLQNKLDKLLSSIIETQSSLQTCLLEWTDFDDNSLQIQKWIKDCEKQLSDTALRVDSSEKKMYLHKIKV